MRQAMYFAIIPYLSDTGETSEYHTDLLLAYKGITDPDKLYHHQAMKQLQTKICPSQLNQNTLGCPFALKEVTHHVTRQGIESTQLSSQLSTRKTEVLRI